MSGPTISSIVQGAGTLIGAAGAGMSLFGSKDTPKVKDPPPIQKPAVMPIADDQAAKKAAQAAMLKRQQASGRTSTMLTDLESLG